jgi:hypothetical protein
MKFMNVILLVLSLFQSQLVYADDYTDSRNEDSPFTQIENAQYVCSQDGGAFFISTKDKRVWQTEEIDSQEGLEHQVTAVRVARCPHCFFIESEMTVWGQTGFYKLVLSSSGASQIRLAVQISSHEQNGQPAVQLEMNCQLLNQ